MKHMLKQLGQEKHQPQWSLWRWNVNIHFNKTLFTMHLLQLLYLIYLLVSVFREAFSIFDQNGNGSITSSELAQVMRTLGQNPTEEEITEMVLQIDADGKKRSMYLSCTRCSFS